MVMGSASWVSDRVGNLERAVRSTGPPCQATAVGDSTATSVHRMNTATVARIVDTNTSLWRSWVSFAASTLHQAFALAVLSNASANELTPASPMISLSNCRTKALAS